MGVELFQTLRTVQPQTATEQSAYDKWLTELGTRAGPHRADPRRRRRDPGAAVDRVVLQRGLIFVYMLFFADSGERAPVQR